MYGLTELRRLALLKLALELGLPLDAAVAVLDAPRRATTLDRPPTALLNSRSDRQGTVGSGVPHPGVAVPAGHPANECCNMVGALDRLIAGGQVDELANGS